MQDAARPMPPAPAASASSAEIALLANWLSAGEPHGTCSMGPSGGGAGGAGGAPSTAPDAGSIPSTGASGLPCDVQAVLRSRCQTCHSNPPVGGAVGSLMTLADLTAPSRSNPAQSVGQRAVTRMQDNAAPMPPAPATRATTAEVATVQAWVSAGMPAGTCADAGAPPDAGNPFGTPPTCTSGRTSTVQEGATMDPGMPCVSCHAANSEAPKFSIGGTLYPTAHEPNNCIGTPGGTAGTASVVIVDANNQTLTLAVNAAGNFYSSTAVALPYHAKVVVGTSERVMVAAQTTGDCNSCHTQNGANSAPGRIILP
jgi:hypothetical protein